MKSTTQVGLVSVLVIEHDDDTLVIGPNDLRPEAYSPRWIVLWVNQGRVGLIPQAVLQNTLDQYRQWNKAGSVDARTRPPVGVNTIRWDQTLDRSFLGTSVLQQFRKQLSQPRPGSGPAGKGQAHK